VAPVAIDPIVAAAPFQERTIEMLKDRAGRAYWDSVWAQSSPQLRRLPDGRVHRSRVDRRFARLFQRERIFDAVPGQRLLEIGSAGSTWLPWFAQEGFAVTGIDYSPTGCKHARRLLHECGTDGEIVCADALAPPTHLLGRFDIVISFGVVEHFEDTAATLAAFARFLGPGGRIVTVIPNMAGFTGFVQRLVDREIYDIHMRLTASDLGRAHQDAGLECECRYFMSVNFGVVAVRERVPNALFAQFKRVVLKALAHSSKIVWVLEERFGIAATPRFAPYIVCIARRPHH
jgi:2-polyprenyl-3-methyl-5-hydroxy-6-metoxy-1,4-benzoquinol methylase